ncbi:MAG: class I SAM-dependent methyltransferase [Ktedonobacteraceae bacterium]|nr:class I SAM-dependent methyltransferase [Ktedonobacteraceae bacterium]MBO0789428.1 class I SAM-dependent methyltransferase [Ktedonobacteraceae bacterium]
MPSPFDPQKPEHPSTYMVQNRQNQQELTRLTIQDRMVTASMGGVLPEQADPSIFRRVLDIGSGSGSWCIEAAQTYPSMSLIGIDISRRMIDYASEQARAQQLADRVEFLVMDALRILEFPDGFFDLVDLRLGVSFMRTWDWPKLISEMLRVCREGGIIRVSEVEIIQPSNGPALTRFFECFQCALFRAGHLFANDTTGITAHLAPLLARHGCQRVQTKAYTLPYRAGTEEGNAYFENISHAMSTVRPFLKKWGCVPRDYDELVQRAKDEMKQEQFMSTIPLLTAWGTKE